MFTLKHPDEVEEEQYAGHSPHQELLNCLAEAMPYALAEADPIKYSGAGRFQITVKYPVYCKSTDAHAGWITSAVHSVPSEEHVEAWFAENVRGDDELWVDVKDTCPPPVEAPVTSYADDDCPF